MNTPILNRDFTHPADGWYQIEAKGEHPNKRAGVVQIIDDTSCASICNRFNADAAKPGYAGMLIDREHFKHDEDKDTVAYGWLTRLENRADGIYAQIRWTGTGQKAVDDGDYRFFSTEYDAKDLDVLNTGKPRRVRPMALAGLTLTNVNNNKGQKPITNRNSMETQDYTDEQLTEMILNGDYPGHPFHGNQYGEGSGGMSAQHKASRSASQASGAAMKSGSAEAHATAAIAHHRAAAAANKSGNKQLTLYHDEMANMHADAAKSAARGPRNREFPNGNNARSGASAETQTMKTVLTALGLREDASEQDAFAAVTKINNRNTELQTATVEGDLEIYKDRFVPAQKEFIKSQLITNRAGTVEFLKTLPALDDKGKPVPEKVGKTAPARVHNRATAEAIEKDAGGSTDAGRENAPIIQNRISELRTANPKMTYDKARNLVRQQSPELFGLPARD